jgi:FMN phosphatase YigB (HAD superfamily)
MLVTLVRIFCYLICYNILMKTILVDALNTFVIKDNGIFIEMYELLEKYPNSKIILTNANDTQLIEFGLVNLPYKLFTLKHNPDKTNTEYFNKMLLNFNLTKDDVVYFEHNLGAVKSAESVGIKTYHYNPEIRDLNKLEEFLNINL